MTRLMLILGVAVSLAWAQKGGQTARPAPPVAELPANHQSPEAGDGRVPRGGAEVVHPGGEVQAGHGGEAHAEATSKHGEGHNEQPMPNEIWWKWANFALLAGVLGWLIGKNAGPFFRARSEAIQGGIAEATRTREEAQARAAEIERRVANLSAEVEVLKVRSGEEIAREGERLRAETEAQIRKIQTHAEAEIAAAARHARKELKAWSAQLALDLAEQQIRTRMSPPAQEQLADRFAAELRQKAESH